VLVLFMTLPAFDVARLPRVDLTSSSYPQEIRSHSTVTPRKSFLGLSTRGFTAATGYLATGFLALTLLIGPANLVFRRRNPVSSYLRRDVGLWAAIFSAVHLLFGLQVHARLAKFATYFAASDGTPLTNSFGIANWTGLAALVVVAGLLALSSDAALRRLGAKNWKRLQRLNYALFALVFVHAIFYGAFLRTSSPYTSLLLLSTIAVLAGQAIGVLLYRRRQLHARRRS
jgi:sulfoxide reductase heme-binding subunit YedZ